MLRLVRNRVSAWWINVSSATPTTLLYEADQHLRKTMNLQKAIEIAGSKSKLATLLGVSRAAVTQWDELPEKRINQLKGINEWQTHFSGEQDKAQSQSISSVNETSPQ